MTPQIVVQQPITKEERERILQQIDSLIDQLRAAGDKYTLEVINDRQRRRKGN